MEWGFIRHILCFNNFLPAWIDLIMACITTSNLSILANGERLHLFTPSRGIRQGDPLSLYIFILCMEYLAHLIQQEVNLKNWAGIKSSRDGPTFMHFFFANDLILFAKASKKNCTTIKKHSQHLLVPI